MTTAVSSVANAPASSRRKKVRAVLASGTVLGIGAVVTMATWNDSQFAQGIFEAGDYSVTSSQNGSDFQDHGSANGAAQLSFADFGATNAAPGEEFAASFWLRTSADSTYDGRIADISVVNDSATGQYTNFQDITVRHVDGGECAPGSDSGSVIASGQHLGDLTSSNHDEVRLSHADGAAGEPVQLCFQATATDDLNGSGNPVLKSGESASATWSVQTESVSGNN